MYRPSDDKPQCRKNAESASPTAIATSKAVLFSWWNSARLNYGKSYAVCFSLVGPQDFLSMFLVCLVVLAMAGTKIFAKMGNVLSWQTDTANLSSFPMVKIQDLDPTYPRLFSITSTPKICTIRNPAQFEINCLKKLQVPPAWFKK